MTPRKTLTPAPKAAPKKKVVRKKPTPGIKPLDKPKRINARNKTVDSGKRNRGDQVDKSSRWQKGESGNPAGVSKVRRLEIANMRLEAQKYGKEAIQTLVDVMRDGDAPPGARSGAAAQILDRGYGKAPQAITGPDGEGPVEAHITVSFVKPEGTPLQRMKVLDA